MRITMNGVAYDDVSVRRDTYLDGTLALRLDDLFGPLATATVHLDHEQPSEGCVWIKDYSENTGILASLTEAGVIAPTGRVVQAGFTHVHEARVL
jgi:hypothetical protein